MSAVRFGAAALQDLEDRTEYEAWLLEAVYRIADQPIRFGEFDELIYPPDGSPPAQVLRASGAINIGDWRPGFLKAGAPLVLVANFKLLDMLLEWILVQNGHSSTFRFEQKIQALKGPITFPLLIARRPWLSERLIALYEHLEPLRGTIIHDRHFTSTSGTLEVSRSKGGSVGPTVAFGQDDLRKLAALLVSLLRYLEGGWAFDEFKEKVLRRLLDELVVFHGSALLGQHVPAYLSVRVYARQDHPLRLDLDRIRADIAVKRPSQDVMFQVRVVAIDAANSSAWAYLLPWDSVRGQAGVMEFRPNELASHPGTVPDGLDLAALGANLGDDCGGNH